MSGLKNAVLAGLRLCPDCDLLVRIRSFDSQPGWKIQAICPCCNRKLEKHQPASVLVCLSLTVTGLILFIPANLFPVMAMNILGNIHQSTVLEGALALHSEGLWFVAWLVIATAIVIPLLRLLILLQVLLSVITGTWRQLASRLFRWYTHLGEWGMMEIYLLGALVAVIKLSDLASIQLGYGLYCFISLILVELAISIYLNQDSLWDMLGSRS